MRNRTTPIVLTAVGAALLFAAPSYAQDRPHSVAPPPKSAHKSFLKAEGTAAGKVTEVPQSDAAKMKDIPEGKRSDNTLLK
jgi:hypothetical protein